MQTCDLTEGGSKGGGREGETRSVARGDLDSLATKIAWHGVEVESCCHMLSFLAEHFLNVIVEATEFVPAQT
jgi:hypothetical protein